MLKNADRAIPRLRSCTAFFGVAVELGVDGIHALSRNGLDYGVISEDLVGHGG